MKKRNNTLKVEDHDFEVLHSKLREEKQKAFVGLTIAERIKYFEDHNVELEPYHAQNISIMLAEASNNFRVQYPVPKGLINFNQVIIGEVHDQAENLGMYADLLKELKVRGFNSLTFEFSLSKEAQDRLNDAFLIVRDGSIKPEMVEDAIIQNGAVAPFVYALKNDMRVLFIDQLDRGFSDWDRHLVPNIPFDPNNPNTIVDKDIICHKAKLDAEIFHNRNLTMVENILSMGDEKFIHIGGRNHNLGLQSLIEQKTGKTPISIVLDYPSNRHLGEGNQGGGDSHGVFTVEYVRDIIIAIDNLTESSPSKNIGFVPAQLDDFSGSEAATNQVKSYLLSGVVGQIMAKAASLSVKAPEQQSRIFMVMMVALAQVSVVNVNLENIRNVLFDKKEAEKEKGKDRKRKDRDEEERHKKKKLEEMEEKLMESDSLGDDFLSVFHIFKRLTLSAISVPLLTGGNTVRQPLNLSSKVDPVSLMKLAGVSAKGYSESKMLAQYAGFRRDPQLGKEIGLA